MTVNLAQAAIRKLLEEYGFSQITGERIQDVGKISVDGAMLSAIAELRQIRAMLDQAAENQTPDATDERKAAERQYDCVAEGVRHQFLPVLRLMIEAGILWVVTKDIDDPRIHQVVGDDSDGYRNGSILLLVDSKESDTLGP